MGLTETAGIGTWGHSQLSGDKQGITPQRLSGIMGALDQVERVKDDSDNDTRRLALAGNGPEYHAAQLVAHDQSLFGAAWA